MDVHVVAINRDNAAGQHHPFGRSGPIRGFQYIDRALPGGPDQALFRIFNRGDGKDLIHDTSGSDNINFGDGITKDELVFKQYGNTLVIGIIRGEEVIIPSGDSIINPEDRVVIFAQKYAIPKVEKLLSSL